MQPGDCPFCMMINGESRAAIIHEDNRLFVFLDNRPASPGHTIIATRAHAPDLFSVDRELLALAARLCKAMGSEQL